MKKKLALVLTAITLSMTLFVGCGNTETTGVADETIANIAITLIHQTDWMLNKLIEKLEIKFVESGGMREQMTKARKDYRGY